MVVFKKILSINLFVGLLGIAAAIIVTTAGPAPEVGAAAPGYDACVARWGAPLVGDPNASASQDPTSPDNQNASRPNILLTACMEGYNQEDGTERTCGPGNFEQLAGTGDGEVVTGFEQSKACHLGYFDNPNRKESPAIEGCSAFYHRSGLRDSTFNHQTSKSEETLAPINHSKDDVLFKACVKGWVEETVKGKVCVEDNFREQRLFNTDGSLILKNGGHATQSGNSDEGEGDAEQDDPVDPISVEDQVKACKKGFEANPTKRLPPKSACKVTGFIGWLICPTATILSKATDSSFHVLTDFMRYDAISSEQSGNNTVIEKSWAQMRDFANIVVVIAIIMIVFSYITGAGLSNYNIKRMLPRVIVMIILINLSYWVCTLAIDASNIAGANVYKLMSQLLNGSPTTYEFPCNNVADPLGGDNTKNFTCTTFAVLSGHSINFGTAFLIGGALLATLAFLFPVMFTALGAIVVVIFILMARQALITVLIIVSPLAFAAYLLPNTQKWFDRWKGIFTTLLLLYPLIGLVFGGAMFASQLIQIADGSHPAVLFVILSLGIQVIPLFIVPATLKSTGGMLGNLTNRAQGQASGVFNKGRAKAQQMKGRRQMSRATGALSKASKNPPKGRLGRAALYARSGKKGREIIRGQKDKDVNMALKDAQQSAWRNEHQGVDDFEKMAGGDRGLASKLAAESAQKTHAQEQSHVNSLAESYGKKNAQELAEMLDNPNDHSEEELAAALTRMIDIGEGHDTIDSATGETIPGYAKYIDDHMGNGSTIVTRAVGRAVEHKQILSSTEKSRLSNGTASSYGDSVMSSLADGHLSQAGMAQSSSSDLSYADHLANSATVAAPGGTAVADPRIATVKANLKSTANQLSTPNNPHAAHVGENRGSISNFRGY